MAADAQIIGELARQFADYLRSLGDMTDFQFNAETYLRDGFGPNPAFAGIVAEANGEVAGYLLYHFGYDVDRALRLLHVIDLYVRPEVRGRGVGRALMDEAARLCREGGGRELCWAVYRPNILATQFTTDWAPATSKIWTLWCGACEMLQDTSTPQAGSAGENPQHGAIRGRR